MNFKLIAKRKERGLKQSEVAEAVGVSAMAISYYENGTREPKSDIKKKLADFYGCEESELFGAESKTTNRKMAGFNAFNDDGELNVDGYAKFLEQNQPEVDGVKSVPIEWFDSLLLIEIHQMLKKLISQGKGE